LAATFSPRRDDGGRRCPHRNRFAAAHLFSGPPAVIVLPDTPDVYVVPYIEVDLFFWGGWWWRPWEGRWYRSHYYDRGWVYYGGVPNFYFYVDPGWRDCFRSRNWHGHPWNHHYIPHHELQRNWKTWQANRYWEKKKSGTSKVINRSHQNRDKN